MEAQGCWRPATPTDPQGKRSESGARGAALWTPNQASLPNETGVFSGVKILGSLTEPHAHDHVQKEDNVETPAMSTVSRDKNIGAWDFRRQAMGAGVWLSSQPPGVRLGTVRTIICYIFPPSFSMFLFLYFLSRNRTRRQSWGILKSFFFLKKII